MRTIALTKQKGGAGRTTLAVALAVTKTSLGVAPEVRIIRGQAHGVTILLDGQVLAQRAKSCALVTAPAGQDV